MMQWNKENTRAVAVSVHAPQKAPRGQKKVLALRKGSSFKQSPSSATAQDAAEQKTSFEFAAERARARYPAEIWSQLGPGERSQAIYQELRALDEEIVRAGRNRG